MANSVPEIVAPSLRDLDALSHRLSVWLRPRLQSSGDVRVSNLAYPKGAGLSHETILFDAHWDSGGRTQSQGLVVRIKPTGHLVYQDDLFDIQFKIMKTMYESGIVRVAKALWIEHDPELLGAPFFVMGKVTGRVAVSFPPYSQQGWLFDASPSERRRLWTDAVTQLASIQKVPRSAVPFLEPREGSGFDQEWNRFSRYLAWIEERRTIPFLRDAWLELRGRMPEHRPPGIVWGDARLGNMMVGDDFRVKAVMDWEQPSLGGALHDLGWWLMIDLKQTTARGLARLDGMGSREETLLLWSELSGVSTTDIEWYEAFAAFKTACLFTRLLDLTIKPVPGEDHGDNLNSRVLADYLGMDRPKSLTF